MSEGAGPWMSIHRVTGIRCPAPCRVTPVPFLGVQGALPAACAARWLGFNLLGCFLFFSPSVLSTLGSRELQGSSRFSGVAAARGWHRFPGTAGRSPSSPTGCKAPVGSPLSACLGGNAGGLLLLSASIFRARRGFWQRCRPAHAALSGARLGKDWQLCWAGGDAAFRG